MLRHFKMEIKRQQERENESLQFASEVENAPSSEFKGQSARPLVMVAKSQGPLNMKKQQEAGNKQPLQQQQQAKRVRGRRSSKPQMEKRRRARINECLDILKSYVLTDTSNLNRLGIDLTASENRDEETIARTILKSSGLINRHRGRKNPNKLEKADILELTVDYVRRLHEQRDELLVVSRTQLASVDLTQKSHPSELNMYNEKLVAAHLSEPLTLDLSPKSRFLHNHASPAPTLQAYAPPPNTPLTPPSSSGSNSMNRAEVEAHQQKYQNQMSQMILSRVLSNYQQHEWTSN